MLVSTNLANNNKKSKKCQIIFTFILSANEAISKGRLLTALIIEQGILLILGEPFS
jgi:hypothetical protein